MATLALFSTEFIAIDNAMTWIYDEEDVDSTRMRHPFVASLPAREPFTTAYEQNMEEDIEHNSVFSSLVCYVCGYEKAKHRELEP